MCQFVQINLDRFIFVIVFAINGNARNTSMKF